LDALSPLLSNFALTYVNNSVQEKPGRAKIEWTHQLLAYEDGVNIVGENTDTIKKIQKLY
jgi:hypothetical protein